MIIKSALWVVLAGALAMLVGCAAAPPEKDHSGRYTIRQDRAPDGNFDASGLKDAQPRFEEPRRAGNKSPYTVWGKKYSVMDDNNGYVAEGMASWYGEKFHGHKTSNGEVFDMYQMTAAHKSLRIPSYARVTNLANGRSVIVRVNDRGPFHGDRMIDLSYAAAKRLGYQGQGVAQVEVAAITVSPDGAMFVVNKPFGGAARAQVLAAQKPTGYSAPRPEPKREPLVAAELSAAERPDSATAVAPAAQGVFVQLASFSSNVAAENLVRKVQNQVQTPMRVKVADTGSGRFHRVQAGPFNNEQSALQAQQLLQTYGFYQTILLTDSR
ncbi:septal ring lytic transglycosylase RlpA family protein [Marinobacter sp. ELB17]|uniref:septal ring lytic transglycosylase RlpA family protein n=1 Tax=Marinobacter sp. ELB17 TaxID=270374 RepID=UPI0000F38D83|nr:septal ring lytic transglycosylase RlpA family protein [Marinobacter sp. ELB17]EBA01195.1 Lipoprotein [Marinobacter sp. ELB17]